MKKIITSVMIVMLIVLVFSIKTNADVTYHGNLFTGWDQSITQMQRGQHVDITCTYQSQTTGNITGTSTDSSQEYDIASVEYQMGLEKSVFEKLNQSDLVFQKDWQLDSFDVTETTTLYQYKIKFSRISVATPSNLVFTSGLNVKTNAKLGKTTLSVISGSFTFTSGTTEEMSTYVSPADTVTIVGNTAQKNPSTGIKDYTIPAILVISALAVLGYVRYRTMK